MNQKLWIRSSRNLPTARTSGNTLIRHDLRWAEPRICLVHRTIRKLNLHATLLRFPICVNPQLERARQALALHYKRAISARLLRLLTVILV